MSQPFPYPLLNRKKLIKQFNDFCITGQKFIFIIDYKAEKGYLIPENDLDSNFIRSSFFEKDEHKAGFKKKELIEWKPVPVSFDNYRKKFNNIKKHIGAGNSFLVNLTQPTKVITNLNIEELYETGNAKYKLWLKDRFTVLSPEIFVRITDGKIFSYPMKGTIDAAIENAEEIILNDNKEKAEHATIVDLIRNDLSLNATGVGVNRYRYIDTLTTNKGKLLQVSSEISGYLPDGYECRLGEIIFAMLPAGSISGAPKPKTLQIIEETEKYDRDFYTGIFGWFDGKNIDSAVMIRFAEPWKNGLIFKSGGGITSQSDAEKEYNELIQKIYVPFR